MATPNNEQLILQKLNKLEHGQSIVYWVLGAMLTIFVFFTILVLTLLFDMWSGINTITGEVQENKAHIEALQEQHITRHQ